MHVLVIKGPNRNIPGTLRPAVNEAATPGGLAEQIRMWGIEMGVEVATEQATSEARIVELIRAFDGDGIVINPGAFTPPSRAIADAISGVDVPVVEVHISDVEAMESGQAGSVVSEACVRTIFGRGIGGYRSAIRHLVNRSAMPFETVRYGPHEDNVADLRRGEKDLVVLAHGGLWKREFERDLTESLAVDLARRGYSTWNIEYRRVSDGGGWPTSGQDVLTALDTVPRLDVDAGTIIVVGHSVGAHLLMWAAPRSVTKVGLHVALGPLVDLKAAVSFDDVGAAECYQMLAEGAPPEPDPEGVETVIVHGDADQIVPVERSVTFAKKHGLEHHRTGCDHFSLLDPSKPEWFWVLERMSRRTKATD